MRFSLPPLLFGKRRHLVKNEPGHPESPPAAAPIRFRRWRRGLTAGGIILLVVGIAGILLFAAVSSRMEVPNLAHLRAGQHPSLGLASVVYSADGQELSRYYRENRTWIAYQQLSPHLLNALIATEDRRFYSHHGVDWFRMLSSLWKTAWGDPQGGSTLTMQLTRNYFPAIGRAPLLKRKLYEIATALKTERVYLKHEIIEMYLNTVPFGYNAFGIETAAQTYFNKPAAALTIVESATLVGMLKAITRYNPVRNPERSRQRRNVVLGQMHKYGDLDRATLERVRQQPVTVDFHLPTTATGIAPHFVEYTRTWLDDWAAQQGYDLYASGLKIYTTLDARAQALAVAAVETQLHGLQAVADYEWSRRSLSLLGDRPGVYQRARAAGRFEPFAYFRRAQRPLIDQRIRRSARYTHALQDGATPEQALAALHADAAFLDSLCAPLTRLEAGFVALDPTDGRILAWVGGRDFRQDQYDKVGLARRQPGSTFKPFVYAAALELGYSPLDQRMDTVRTYETRGRNKTWRPTNAGGKASGDTLTLRDGLAFSKNTITAQLMDEVGPNWVAHVARRMGIRSPLTEVPSLALGTSEVTLLELVAAYSPLSAHGKGHAPFAITHIEDRNGRRIASFAPEPREALSPNTAYDVLEMMRAVVDEGTGIRIRSQFGIRADVAGKTGTTQNNADGWFVLLHPRLSMGAWVGFNDRQITFRSNFWGQGGHNALYVVGDFFKRALDAGLYSPDIRFVPPPGYHPPRHPDSPARATPDPLLASFNEGAAENAGTASPADIEGTLRTFVSHSLRVDTLPTAPYRSAADTAYATPTDSLRPALRSLSFDTLRPAQPPARRAEADTDLEQAMRRLLFPEAEEKDSVRIRRPDARQRDQ